LYCRAASLCFFFSFSLIIKHIFSLPCPIFGLKNPNSRLAVADALTFQGSEIYHVFFYHEIFTLLVCTKKSYLYLFSENEKLLITFYWTATSVDGLQKAQLAHHQPAGDTTRPPASPPIRRWNPAPRSSLLYVGRFVSSPP
jgi:hypothetical protein